MTLVMQLSRNLTLEYSVGELNVTSWVSRSRAQHQSIR